MIRILLTSICILAALPAWADQPRGQLKADSEAPAQGRDAVAPVPQSGVIKPDPNVTVDNTIQPPNVDPKMQIPPPAGAGIGTKVEPK